IPATDNCDDEVEVVVASSISIAEDCPEVEIITRSSTATDNCGNSTTITQTITIVDTTPPVITRPDDLTVECIEDIPAPNVQLVIASDDCSDVIITWEGDTSDSDDCEGTFIRTYRATDACGNFTECTEIINFIDTTDPVFDFEPEDLTIECGDVIPPMESIPATGNC